VLWSQRNLNQKMTPQQGLNLNGYAIPMPSKSMYLKWKSSTNQSLFTIQSRVNSELSPFRVALFTAELTTFGLPLDTNLQLGPMPLTHVSFNRSTSVQHNFSRINPGYIAPFLINQSPYAQTQDTFLSLLSIPSSNLRLSFLCT
jgi:hypothetical protein